MKIPKIIKKIRQQFRAGKHRVDPNTRFILFEELAIIKLPKHYYQRKNSETKHE